MERENTVFQDELNPTFLFMWKGTRVEDEPNYHCHEHLELCIFNPGQESTESAILYMK